MKNPLITLIQYFCKKRHVSQTPTHVMSLKDVRTAMVFIDGSDADYSVTQRQAKLYFESKGIEVHFWVPRQWDITWWGQMKHDKYEDIPDCDMFVALAGEDMFAADLEAIRSNARFKVGCHQIEGNVYDLVLTTPDDVLLRQPVIFSEIQKLLDLIQ